jgi:translation initiation factor IF-1
MPGNDAIEFEAAVIEVLPGGRLRVQLANGHALVARIVRRRQTELGLVGFGDRVMVAVSPSDFSQGVVKQILNSNTKHESSRVR